MSAAACTTAACAERDQELRTAYAELSRARDDAALRRKDESEHRRRVRSVLRSAFEHDREARGDLFMRSWITRTQGPVHALIDRVRSLPARPRPGDLAQLRDLAGQTEVLVRHYTADLDVATFYAESRAELLRIREYVESTGRALHLQYGATAADRSALGCRCVGCELMVGLDDVALPPLTEVPA